MEYRETRLRYLIGLRKRCSMRQAQRSMEALTSTRDSPEPAWITAGVSLHTTPARTTSIPSCMLSLEEALLDVRWRGSCSERGSTGSPSRNERECILNQESAFFAPSTDSSVLAAIGTAVLRKTAIYAR